MGDNNDDEDGGGVDGDGSGGNSPSRQAAETETFVPQTSSSMVAALRNFSWMDADSFRVFTSMTIYRRKGGVRGWPGGPHHTLARLEGGAPPGGVGASWPSSVSALDSISSRENRNFRLHFVQF
jgi:hypothetical protein